MTYILTYISGPEVGRHKIRTMPDSAGETLTDQRKKIEKKRHLAKKFGQGHFLTFLTSSSKKLYRKL